MSSKGLKKSPFEPLVGVLVWAKGNSLRPGKYQQKAAGKTMSGIHTRLGIGRVSVSQSGKALCHTGHWEATAALMAGLN